MNEFETAQWHKIGNKLCNYLQICSCQRKLKSIIDNLYSIYIKCNGAYEGTHERDFTGAEWLLIAILDRHSAYISHGINCEYPIINKDNEFQLSHEEYKQGLKEIIRQLEEELEQYNDLI
jgi:hypothetical protein